MQKYRPDTEESLPVIKIKELNQGYTDNTSDRASINIPEQYIINNGDVVFSWSGTLMVKIWTGGQGGLNQHLFKVTSRNYEKWFYYLWTLEHLTIFRAIAKDRATTMGHIKRGHLTQAKVLVPTESVMKGLSEILIPIFDYIVQISMQSSTLKELRDTLLPKLISGEIRVPIEEVQ
jgi:type I restriction enzyme S subunit